MRLCKEVPEAVAVSRETKRKLAQGQAVLPKFAVGDFVLYARVRRQGVTPKLLSTWTGPWRVVGADHAHVYSVHNIVSGAVHSALVPRLCFMLTHSCTSLRILRMFFSIRMLRGSVG